MWSPSSLAGGDDAVGEESQGEAAESQTLIEIALRCGYWTAETAERLDREFEEIMAMLASMIRDADKWCEGFKG